MKIELSEYEDSFYVEIKAENVSEAAKLARFALNVKREPLDKELFATGDNFIMQCFFKRRKDYTNEISR